MDALVKSQEWHDDRRQGIGGSDATTIMSGDADRITRLAQEKLGQVEPKNLSDVLPVQIGTVTEELNGHWFATHTGRDLTREDCDGLASFEHPFMRANLDGRVVGEDAIFEAKHVNQYSKMESVMERYYWQCQHCMAVTGAAMAYLSVFIGTLDWDYAVIERDEADIALLTEREAEFWSFIEKGEVPPIHEAATVPTLAVDEMRTVDMEGNNAWAAHAADFAENESAAKTFEGAKKEIKGLVEADVKEAYGHGVIAKRSKAGSISIRRQKP